MGVYESKEGAELDLAVVPHQVQLPDPLLQASGVQLGTEPHSTCSCPSNTSAIP